MDSIAHGEWGGGHRKANVRRVENGYVLTIDVERERVDMDGQKRKHRAEEQHVAVTLDEVLAMLRAYFS